MKRIILTTIITLSLLGATMTTVLYISAPTFNTFTWAYICDGNGDGDNTDPSIDDYYFTTGGNSFS